MRQRYRLIRRNSRSGKFYCVDTITNKRESLSTTSEDDARRVVQAKNEAERQPIINRQIAYAYLTASDALMSTRTWQQVMDAVAKMKGGVTKERWERAMREKPFDIIRNRTILETQGEQFIAVL